MKTKWYLKIVTCNMKAPIAGGTHKFKLNKWTPKRTPKLCSSGWHVSTMQCISEFDCYAGRLFVCVARGNKEIGRQKSAHEQIKLVIEIDRAEFYAYFKRAYRKKIVAGGLFTAKAIRLEKTDAVVRSAIERVYGYSYSPRLVNELRDNAQFRAHFKRYVERKLRALGYK